VNREHEHFLTLDVVHFSRTFCILTNIAFKRQLKLKLKLIVKKLNANVFTAIEIYRLAG